MHDGLEQSKAEVLGRTASEVLDLAIVILNFNTSDLLRDCLRSVFSDCGGVSYRVCVVDNASADDSVAMVRREFPLAHLIVSPTNVGYSAGNNLGLRWFGFREPNSQNDDTLPGRTSLVDTPLGNAPSGNAPSGNAPSGNAPSGNAPSGNAPSRYALLLNPDTLLPPNALAAMVKFMDNRPAAGVSGPRVRREDGSLDRACRRSFPTPQVSLYRMTGLSRLFPKSQRFNAYNLEYLPEDSVHQVDSVVGAFMMVRGQAIEQAGLLDEDFFMYGEDLDWAKRIKDAGWENWYNGKVEITHIKRAASRQSIKSRIDFYEAMWIFYQKHYRSGTGWLTDQLIRIGVVGKGSLDVGRHLWRFCGVPENGRETPKAFRMRDREQRSPHVPASVEGMPEA